MRLFKHFELVAWITALIFLAFTNPGQHHFSLCPLENLHIIWCPGCGLGRSVASILRGNFMASLSYHWFGFPALFILLNRIFILLKPSRAYRPQTEVTN
ncbi:MAG TPA: DUF2752 domain-containing protein [Pedobacter sp.]